MAYLLPFIRRPTTDFALDSIQLPEALRRIGELYGIESEIRGRSPEERRDVRNARARPLLEALRDWFERRLMTMSRKSELAKAIRYAVARWESLLRYCDDGQIEVDNNAAERALRAVAVGSSLCTSFSSA